MRQETILVHSLHLFKQKEGTHTDMYFKIIFFPAV